MSRLKRYAFALQCTMAALLSAALSMLTVMVPLYATALGLGAESIGVLVALPGVFPVLLALRAGRWIDLVGPPRMLFTSMTVMTAAPLSLILLPGVAALVVSRLMVGFVQLFVTLSSQSLIADLDNNRSHASNFAAYSTLLALGRMIGPVLVGFIIDHYGFRASFWAVLGVMTLGAGVAFLVMRSAKVSGAHAGGPGDVVGGRVSVRGVVNNVGFQMGVLASSGIFLALTMREAFLPVMLEEMGMSATLIGTLVSLGSLTAVLIRPLLPLVNRLLRGTAKSLVVAMGCVVIGVGLLSVAGSVPFFGILAVVAGIGSGLGFPLSIVSVTTHVSPRQRATALSLRISSNHLVEIVAPILGGLLVAATSYAVGFAAAGVVLAVVTVFGITRVRPFEREERAALQAAAMQAASQQAAAQDAVVTPPPR